jgi:hypothetical protein
MRTALLGIIAAAGIGLAGTATTLAAPANGSAVLGRVATDSLVVKVGHCRYSRWRRWCGPHHWRWSRW